MPAEGMLRMSLTKLDDGVDRDWVTADPTSKGGTAETTMEMLAACSRVEQVVESVHLFPTTHCPLLKLFLGKLFAPTGGLREDLNDHLVCLEVQHVLLGDVGVKRCIQIHGVTPLCVLLKKHQVMQDSF